MISREAVASGLPLEREGLPTLEGERVSEDAALAERRERAEGLYTVLVVAQIVEE